jgi:DNA-binding response OmpR family regulator
MKILAADDDALLLGVISILFSSFGYDVITASDGVSALELVEREFPSAIILDAKMPGWDGFDVLRQIRMNAAHRSIPVIMLTAVDGEEEIVAALRAGATDYVTKPFKPNELLARVERALTRPRLRAVT